MKLKWLVGAIAAFILFLAHPLTAMADDLVSAGIYYPGQSNQIGSLVCAADAFATQDAAEAKRIINGRPAIASQIITELGFLPTLADGSKKGLYTSKFWTKGFSESSPVGEFIYNYIKKPPSLNTPLTADLKVAGQDTNFAQILYADNASDEDRTISHIATLDVKGKGPIPLMSAATGGQRIIKVVCPKNVGGSKVSLFGDSSTAQKMGLKSNQPLIPFG
jgi:hypothetical protein